MDINHELIKDNIDFILSHFDKQHELFPRTIMTSKSGGQVVIEYESEVESSKDKIFRFFMEANFIDCKINAFPYNTEHTVDLDVKNKTAATFIMIDLDLKDFNNSKEKLDLQLKRTINKFSTQFEGKAQPTILWTGNGYHIYQPINGLVFEKFTIFYDFLQYLDGRDLTTEFLRFSEDYFTNNKADPQHSPSVRSCLIRVPGTFNSKNNEEVKIILRWNGYRPPIPEITTTEFLSHLIQKRIYKIQKVEREQKLRTKFANSPFNKNNTNAIGWIEKLLQTPIEDYRKYCLWRILCPYLINIKKLTKEETTIIIKDWLEKCNKLRKLEFNPQREVSSKLRSVGPFLPSAKEKLKKEQPKLYNLLIEYDIIQKA